MPRFKITGRQEQQYQQNTPTGVTTVTTASLFVQPVDAAGNPLNGSAAGPAGQCVLPVTSLADVEALPTGAIVELSLVTV